MTYFWFLVIFYGSGLLTVILAATKVSRRLVIPWSYVLIPFLAGILIVSAPYIWLVLTS